MADFIGNLLRSDFLPHGVCYRWSPGVVWLHVFSDLLIALAYYFIPFALLYIVRSRRDLVYPWMFWLFGVFILACGTTHLMNIWVIWHPVYRLDGAIKLITALASVPTAILLIRLAPAVVALPSPEQLRLANVELEHEIAERKAVEAQVRQLNAELEQRVDERTRELRGAMQKLRESEMRMHAILDSAPTIVYVKDLNGRFDFVNRRFEQIFELSREQVSGQTDYDIFPAAQADLFRQADRTAIQNRQAIEVEEVAYRGDEKRTYVSIKFPLIDSTSEPYALCGISTDITDRKNAEEALRHYNRELEQFAFIAAHDLQEPLRTVKSYAQLLTRRYGEVLEGDGQEFLDYIVSGVTRMVMLVDDLQSYTEVANRKDPERALCDLNGILRDTERSMEASIRESNAEIVAEELPVVVASPGQMGQLFQNLLSNAIKYSADNPPRIEITVLRTPREWTIRFKDNGVGVPEKYSEQIFGVFKRLHGREIPGTGVGLAICKQIVEQHRGRIWVESSPGNGATFAFTLPA